MATTAAAAAVVVAIVFAGLFYYTVDPESGWMPRCAFKAFTGYDCPGCGFQRALHALLHGDVADAWRYNAFAFFAVPGGIYYIIVEAGRRRWPHLHAASVNPWVIGAVAVGIVGWWILRN